MFSVLCAAVAAGVALVPGRAHFRKGTAPPEMQAAIGTYLKALIPWQAALVALGGAPAAPAVMALALCAVLAGITAKWFAQS
jgi:hypothetical protein